MAGNIRQPILSIGRLYILEFVRIKGNQESDIRIPYIILAQFI